MPLETHELSNQLADAVATARRSLQQTRERNLKVPVRLRRLTRRRTEAFCDLARHYLPQLSHESLANTWVEVRDKIRDLLLRRDDRCRQLRSQLQQVRSQREKVERELDALRERLEQARLDLSSKTGSYKKRLRHDAGVKKRIDEIAKVDKEIERCLAEFDAMKTQADRKLPDYEASSLFNYLKDREFGTPLYEAQGLERHWDRWVAKLIDYEKAKVSFDFLSDAPIRLQTLIDEKRDRYKTLLEKLDSTRERAMTQFGVQVQTRLWLSLGKQVSDLEESIQQHCREQTRLETELQQAEDINGTEYRQSIAIYQQFLEQLDSEIIRVYAACTESPVDDEICARLRGIQQEIATAQGLSKQHADEIAALEKYASGLDELRERLLLELRNTTVSMEMEHGFRLQPLLSELRNHKLSPSQVWRRIRAAMILVAELLDEPPALPNLSPATNPLEASFLAASHPLSAAEPKDLDPTGVRLSKQPDPSANDSAQHHQFREVAKCMTEADALSITSMLDAHDIRCFTHDDSVNHRSQPPGLITSGELRIMVETDRFEEACRLFEDRRRSHEAKWNCSECESEVDHGYHRCWRCGNPRPT